MFTERSQATTKHLDVFLRSLTYENQAEAMSDKVVLGEADAKKIQIIGIPSNSTVQGGPTTIHIKM